MGCVPRVSLELLLRSSWDEKWNKKVPIVPRRNAAKPAAEGVFVSCGYFTGPCEDRAVLEIFPKGACDHACHETLGHVKPTPFVHV